MFKFIHTADLHMDSPLKSLALKDAGLAERVGTASRQAFVRVVETCLEHAVQALLIAGDLFDGEIKSRKTVAFVIAQFERLSRAGVRVFIILGNHDALSLGDDRNRIEWPPNVTVFTGRGECIDLPEHGVAVHGISFREKTAPESLLPKLKSPIPERFNIGLLHTSLAGSEGHDVYAPCSLNDLVAHGYDYWALGHIHKRQVHASAPWIVMPGMPQGRDIGESGQKSVTLVTVEAGQAKLTEIPTSIATFERVAHDLGELHDWRAAKHAVVQTLIARQRVCGAFLIARVEIKGHGDFAWRLRRDQDQFLEELRAEAGDPAVFAIEELTVTVTEVSSPNPDAAAHSELISLMREISASPSLQVEAEQIMGDIVDALPPKSRSAFGNTETERAEILAELLGEGIAELSARLAVVERSQERD